MDQFAKLAAAGIAGALLTYLMSRKTRPIGLRHVVMFRFKPGAPVDDIVKAFDALGEELKHLLIGYERGVQSSPEGLHNGGADLTHAFTLTFPHAAARAEYLPHARHQHFVETFVKPHIESVCVFDYVIEYSKL